MDEIDQAVRNRGRYDIQYRIRRVDGQERVIRAIAACYRAADNSERLVGCNWDVTADVAPTGIAMDPCAHNNVIAAVRANIASRATRRERGPSTRTATICAPESPTNRLRHMCPPPNQHSIPMERRLDAQPPRT